MARYRRILVKFSGGALRPQEAGEGLVHPAALNQVARQLASLRALGAEVAVVMGGGNIFRGRDAAAFQIERAEADQIGMLATVINAMFLRGALVGQGYGDVRVMTAQPMTAVAEPYIRLKAAAHLDRGRIVILAGGTGQPYQTTDYPAVQRAGELGCEAVLIAKDGASGVYEADPRTHPRARAYQVLNATDLLRQELQVMDPTAVMLARDLHLPIHVVGADDPDHLVAVFRGEDVGTLVHWDLPTRLRDSLPS
jgi:uridylate kinase